MTAMEEAGMEMADWIIGKKLHLMPASSKKKHSSASSGIEFRRGMQSLQGNAQRRQGMAYEKTRRKLRKQEFPSLERRES